jgi:DUF438 domain-containing protein
MPKVNSEKWLKHLPCAVTVCDKDFTILYMNEKSARTFEKDGGKKLIGKNLMDCHPPEAAKKLKKLLASGRPNTYTVEKKGVRKLIYQAHWLKGGKVAGLIEFSIELPKDMPHFVRD